MSPFSSRSDAHFSCSVLAVGVAGVLEALAEYCDRSADTAAEANEGMGPAPPGIELRAWSKRIGGLSKEAPAKKS
ncbi:MAG: hypothetical protein ABSD38_27755 [Syntrophorhabdales bacterium]